MAKKPQKKPSIGCICLSWEQLVEILDELLV